MPFSFGRGFLYDFCCYGAGLTTGLQCHTHTLFAGDDNTSVAKRAIISAHQLLPVALAMYASQPQDSEAAEAWAKVLQMQQAACGAGLHHRGRCPVSEKNLCCG